MEDHEYRQELLKRYALAQYYLGIDITLIYKRKYIGRSDLDTVPIHKLEKLIEIYRKLYNDRNK